MLKNMHSSNAYVQKNIFSQSVLELIWTKSIYFAQHFSKKNFLLFI